jgi:S-adenosylmethionine hydrolase
VKPNATLIINRKTIRDFRTFYGEDSATTPFAIWGSAGFLELSINGASAAKHLRAKPGTPVVLRASNKK